MPISAIRPSLLLLGTMLLTVAVYWNGLSGPFLFDDLSNFIIIQSWLEGKVDTQQAILGHQSIFFARPVAMASFLLSAALGEGEGFQFKLGNLAIHLACGTAAFFMLKRALSEDRSLSAHAGIMASALTALWLLHPLHVSTVLYAVQRMAQLSTLFTLASVLVYLIARTQLATGQARTAGIHLFASFPLLVIMGLLSKQNAAVAPLLCFVLEIAYFRNQPRNRVIPIFFGLFLAIPATAFLILLITSPSSLLIDYEVYDFNLTERLMSQSRAIMDYLGQILLPRGPLMGLYTDDFQASISLTSPISTLFSILALLTISSLAIALRTRAPSIFAGWFFFLVAHSVESGILPLDLYFEHRNYLPSVGILLAIGGSYSLFLQLIAKKKMNSFRLGAITITGLLLILAFGTFSRAEVWAHKQSIIEQGLRNHPTSLRANLDNVLLAFQSKDIAKHDQILRNLVSSSRPRHRLIGRLYQITSRCLLSGEGDQSALQYAVTDTADRVTLTEFHAFSNLVKAWKAKGCGNISNAVIAESIIKLLEATPTQPERSHPKWLLRFQAATLYSDAGMWEEAEEQARLAWQPNADAAVGILLSQIQARRGNPGPALLTLKAAAARTKCHDKTGLEAIGRFWVAFSSQASALNTREAPLPFELRCRAF